VLPLACAVITDAVTRLVRWIETVVLFCNRQERRRPHHRFIAVASVPLSVTGFVDLGRAEGKLTNDREEVRVCIDRCRGVAFELPDRRLELRCFYDILSESLVSRPSHAHKLSFGTPDYRRRRRARLDRLRVLYQSHDTSSPVLGDAHIARRCPNPLNSTM
jgi:hypothetical protein